jgi:hypothetical protein
VDEMVVGDWDEVQFLLGLGPRKTRQNIYQAEIEQRIMEYLKNRNDARDQPAKGFSSSIKKTSQKKSQKKKRK